MDRALHDSQLTSRHSGRICFSIATREDDGEIRRLLRENPTVGQISLSLEREPNYFFDSYIPNELKQTIVARERHRVVCMGSAIVRWRFVNGEARRVGYLGALRLDAAYAGRFDIIRRGYEFFHELQLDSPADFYFTSIASDNVRARKFLERRLPGMPRYEFLGEFVTGILRTSFRGSSCCAVDAVGRTVNDLVSDLNDHNKLCQFSPTWSVEELNALEPLGLRSQHFVAVPGKGGSIARAALWDQRAYKQTVIRGYSPLLQATRPVLNVGARMLGRPGLPAVGAILANAFVSHSIVDTNEPNALVQLVSAFRSLAAEHSLDLLTLGFASNDTRLATIRAHFPCREYRSRLYLVTWPEIGNSSDQLDRRILAPEVALM